MLKVQWHHDIPPRHVGTESDFISFNDLVHFLFVLETGEWRGPECEANNFLFLLQQNRKIFMEVRGAERGKWKTEQKVLIFLFLSIFHNSRQVNGNFAKTGF